jgi:hypothetical protein
MTLMEHLLSGGGPTRWVRTAVIYKHKSVHREGGRTTELKNRGRLPAASSPFPKEATEFLFARPDETPHATEAVAVEGVGVDLDPAGQEEGLRRPQVAEEAIGQQFPQALLGPGMKPPAPECRPYMPKLMGYNSHETDRR